MLSPLPLFELPLLPPLGSTWTWTGGFVGEGVVCAGGCSCAGGVMSWTLATGPAATPGIGIWAVGVPGGTSTVTVTCAPPMRVTSSVRCSAEAGIVAAPNPARRRPAVARPMSSLRLCMRRRDVLVGTPGGVTLPWGFLAVRRTVSGLLEGKRGTWVAVGLPP